MQLKLLFTTLLCFVLINRIQPQELEGRFISWDIAKLQFLQAKLIAIRDFLINALTALTQLELALLQAIIDALRRLGGLPGTGTGSGTLIVAIKDAQMNEEDFIKFLEHCNDLIKTFEKIQEDKKLKQIQEDKMLHIKEGEKMVNIQEDKKMVNIQDKIDSI